MLTCNNCGEELSDDSIFCNKCGFKVSEAEIPVKAELIDEIDLYFKIKLFKLNPKGRRSRSSFPCSSLLYW